MSWNDTNRCRLRPSGGRRRWYQGCNLFPHHAAFYSARLQHDLLSGLEADARHGGLEAPWAAGPEHGVFAVYGHGDGGGGRPARCWKTSAVWKREFRVARPMYMTGCAPSSSACLRGCGPIRTLPHLGWRTYLEFHRGTLTSVAKNKRNNRLAEQTLRELEALASLAMVEQGAPYPSQTLHRLWRIVLLNQFHDILAGSSIGAVFDDSDRDYAEYFR